MCLEAIGSCWRLRSRGWSGEMYRLRPYLVLEYLSLPSPVPPPAAPLYLPSTAQLTPCIFSTCCIWHDCWVWHHRSMVSWPHFPMKQVKYHPFLMRLLWGWAWKALGAHQCSLHLPGSLYLPLRSTVLAEAPEGTLGGSCWTWTISVTHQRPLEPGQPLVCKRPGGIFYYELSGLLKCLFTSLSEGKMH